MDAALAPLVDVAEPGLHAVDRPAAEVGPGGVLIRHVARAGGGQGFAVVVDQVGGGGPAFLDRQRAQHEVGEVAPRLALAHQLPVVPDPFAVGAQKAVALVRVAVHEAARAGLGAGEFGELVEGVGEQLGCVVDPARQKGLVARLGEVQRDVVVHAQHLLGVDLGGHRGLQPGLRRQQRAAPQGAVQHRQRLQGLGHAIDAQVVRAVAELAFGRAQVFHHHDAAAPAVIVPVGVVRARHRCLQLIAHHGVEAGLEFADVAALETLRPVGLQAHLARNVGGRTDLVEVERQPQLRGVAVLDLHHRHASHLDAGVAVPQQPGEPLRSHLVQVARQAALAGGIGAVRRRWGHTVSWVRLSNGS